MTLIMQARQLTFFSNLLSASSDHDFTFLIGNVALEVDLVDIWKHEHGSESILCHAGDWVENSGAVIKHLRYRWCCWEAVWTCGV